MIRSELDVLLDKVQDEALRADLKTQIDRLKERRSYGLVFERHIPERVRLPQREIRIGSRVVLRDGPDNPTWEVASIEDGNATLTPYRDAQGSYIQRGEHADIEKAPIDSLVVISEFGEPVLPGLKSVGSIERGGDKPYHVVINGENHHALEALRFTHAGKIDCIYIDPPYNSGGRKSLVSEGALRPSRRPAPPDRHTPTPGLGGRRRRRPIPELHDRRTCPLRSPGDEQ